ncbi:MAG: hypothetical protein L0229_06045 [Blastocatellia bacterium]|nr:hypothetical protein [Blastocatellia bacterium]
MIDSLRDMYSSLSSNVERRLFSEYGAVFVTAATPPPTIIFADAVEVETFQSSLRVEGAVLGVYYIELQSQAMEHLARATDEIRSRGGCLTARASDAGRRSFEDTVRLWTRNVDRGLDHWESLDRISPARARAISNLPPAVQVEAILELEEAEQLYFGTYFDRSILYSVAAPGASQHLSMLAFDATEFSEEAVERTLNRLGWYHTVANDLPHFTFLGHSEDALPELGLKRVSRLYDGRNYNFWVPEINECRIIEA